MFSFNKSRVNFEEPLGEGAHGAVYAYNQKDPKDDQYVVKRITTPKVDIMLSSMQEIVLGFNCDHPHVLPIKGYHIGFDKENKLWNIYMKMPRMVTSLKEKINKYAREGKSFTEEEIIKYFYSLTLGLRYLHEKRIAHRDIKPDNILIDKNGQFKIADIGIGKLVEDENTETLTQALGTRLYTAPEIFTHENKLNKKGLFVADIWSLGVIMAEICVQKTRLVNTNISGKENETNLTKILNGLKGKYSQTLLDLVCRMLRADPQERISLDGIQKGLEETFSKILVPHPFHHNVNNKFMSQDAKEREGFLQKENETLKLYIEQLQKQIKQLEAQIAQLYSDKLLDIHIPQGVNKNDEEVELYKTKFQGNCIKTLTGHTSYLYCLHTLPMDHLASGLLDKTIKIWNYKTGDCIQTLKGHTGYVVCLQLLPAGELVSGSYDKTIKLWDLKTSNCIQTLIGHTDVVRCLKTLPTGRLVSGSYDRTIKLWNPQTGVCLNTLKGHTNWVYCLRVLSVNTLASGSEDKTIKIWDLKTGNCLKTLKGHNDTVTCFEMLPTGELVSGSCDCTIRFWDVNTGNYLRILQGHTGMIWYLQLLPTDDLASGSEDKTIKIWDLKTGNCIKTLQGHTDQVNCLQLLSTGELVSGSNDKTIKIWQ